MKQELCRHLRTKKMYIPAQADEIYSAADEDAASVGHCWCNRTLTETGEDDQPVHPTRCIPQRRCFED